MLGTSHYSHANSSFKLLHSVIMLLPLPASLGNHVFLYYHLQFLAEVEENPEVEGRQHGKSH